MTDMAIWKDKSQGVLSIFAISILEEASSMTKSNYPGLPYCKEAQAIERRMLGPTKGRCRK